MKEPYKGKILTVQEWEQDLFDGSSETFERVVRRPTVQVFVVENQELLVLRESQPGRNSFLGLPGGRVDDGEDPVDAARRELVEETRLTARFIDRIGVHRQRGCIHWDTTYFVARVEGEPEQRENEGERIEPMWMSYEEVLSRVARGEFRNPYFRELVLRSKVLNQESFEGILDLFAVE
mgnify:CR=1 FL=1